MNKLIGKAKNRSERNCNNRKLTDRFESRHTHRFYSRTNNFTPDPWIYSEPMDFTPKPLI
jgi:hypothetical protein